MPVISDQQGDASVLMFSGEVTDGNGAVYMYAEAHEALTKNKLYGISPATLGYVTYSIPAAGTAVARRVGIATDATASGGAAKLLIKGFWPSLVTPAISVSAGHTLQLVAGAIADGAAFSDFGDGTLVSNEFATHASETASSSATTHPVYLWGNLVAASAA